MSERTTRRASAERAIVSAITPSAEPVALEPGKLYRLHWTDPNHPGSPDLGHDCPAARYVGASDYTPPAGQTFTAGSLTLHTFDLLADVRQTPAGQTEGCTWAAIGQSVHIADELLTAEAV
jgi:hypothetical protein